MSDKQTLASLSQLNEFFANAFLATTHACFDVLQSLAELNFSTACQVLNDQATDCKRLLGATDIQQVLAIQTELANTLLQRSSAYARTVHEVTTTAAGELAPSLQSQYADLQSAVADGVRRIAEAYPCKRV
jgi:phasin family protein